MAYHEKIFKRQDGLKVKVMVTLRLDRGGIDWSVDAATCRPPKRTWTNVVDTNDYSYRKLSMEERRQFERVKVFEQCTDEEIREVKTELWMSLKP